MVRAIGSVVLGYVVMAVAVFATFSVAYLLLGADGSFKPGTYDVSTLWLVVSIVLSFGAAVLGGFVCAAVAKRSKPPKVLAAIVLVLGLALAMPTLTGGDGDPMPRPDDVDNVEAMQNAVQPLWITLLNPLIGAAGVLVGARRRKNETGVPIM
ncbi:MAG: hypothetical protein PVJ43_13065 [Gemmatimonadales bacterium]|jgi:hypothetical protein